jgi:hypothetical protein
VPQPTTLPRVPENILWQLLLITGFAKYEYESLKKFAGAEG